MTASEVDKTVSEAIREFRETVKNPQCLQEASTNLYNELIEEIVLGIAFDVHKSYKRGFLNLQPEETEQDVPDGEVFSQSKKILECVCPIPNCNRTVAAAKFAAHLQSCMGMGRNSSRLANLRNKDRDNTSYVNSISDDEADADWTGGDKKRKKKDTKNSRKVKPKTMKNADSDILNMNEGTLSASVSYESLNDEKNGLSQSSTDSTKKKSKDYRKSQKIDVENFNVDIEGNEDDSVSLKESLELNSNNSSPGDNSSSSSKKREKSSKSKSKSSKKNSPSNSNKYQVICTITKL